ncbi:hypothetical protein ADK38_36580 [Streptomyces varsoviensis]|uniref:Uncharacterized protein n=1 Tax=Streptomyces varsoviensis TaxID=67373 RepID=A0ABR5IWC6_9ACTN|nr:hypothetical protein ADK38_36580 [Streptomyces varsoviensis]
MLAHPVRRAAVLKPRFRFSAALALLPGVLAALAAAVVLRVIDLASFGGALLAALPAALCLPCSPSPSAWSSRAAPRWPAGSAG